MITIASSLLSLDIVPEVGGKVGQISDIVSGHKFLVPPQKEYQTIPREGDWLKHDTSGMDDCFPNVAAGFYPDEPWSSYRLPDLGEWTHGTWDAVSVSGRQVVLAQLGEVLPYSAIKTIQFVDEDTILFSYSVRNLGKSSMRFLWSAHPLIAVGSDYELELPGDNLTMQTFPPDGGTYTWPGLDGTDLSRQWIAQGKSRKIFITELDEGWCSLRLPKHQLRFTFDLRTLPAVGLWFNHYAFPAWNDTQFRCIAVEPCTTPSDLLDVMDAANYPSIPAGGTKSWSMQLSITLRVPDKF